MPEQFEQAKALYEKGDYAAAKEAFEAAIAENEEDARAWNGLANTYLQAGEYDEAYEAYQQALQWDASYAPAWHGLGVALEQLEDFPQAQEAFQQAIRLDRDFASAWNALGALYLSHLGKPEEGIRCFQRCEFLAKGLFANNYFALFSQLPNYPFFSWRIIQNYMPLQDYERWGEYLKQTMQDATPLLAYQSWLSLRRQKGDLPEGQYRLWMGLAHLLMGDPATALVQLNQYQALQSELDLMAAYYQLQACWEFHEPDAAYLQPAREKAAAFLPPEQDSGWQFWKKKEAAPPLPPKAYQDCYYAGMIFVYNDELDKAMACFERIEREFLPAAYQALWLCEEIVQPKKKKEKAALLLDQEAAKRQFTEGLQPITLSLDDPSPLAALLPVMRYQELADAIEVLHFYSEFEGNPFDFEVLNSREQPPFFQLWTLPAQVEQQIFSQVQEEMKGRALEKMAGSAAAPLAGADEALAALAQPLDLEQFLFLLVNFVAEEKLTEYEMILSVLYKLYSGEDLPADNATVIGERARAILGDGLAGILNLPEAHISLSAILHRYESRIAAGKLLTLAGDFLENQTSLTSFSYFREQFEAFIGDQRQELEEALTRSGAS